MSEFSHGKGLWKFDKSIRQGVHWKDWKDKGIYFVNDSNGR